MKYLGLLLLASSLLFTACQDEPLVEDLPEKEEDTTMNEGGKLMYSATFESRVHPTSGTVELLEINDRRMTAIRAVRGLSLDKLNRSTGEPRQQ